jgi:hypothetical protein
MNIQEADRLLAKVEAALTTFTEGKDWDPRKVSDAQEASTVLDQYKIMVNAWKRDGLATGDITKLATYMDFIMNDAEQFKKEAGDYVASVKLLSPENRAAGGKVKAAQIDAQEKDTLPVKKEPAEPDMDGSDEDYNDEESALADEEDWDETQR